MPLVALGAPLLAARGMGGGRSAAPGSTTSRAAGATGCRRSVPYNEHLATDVGAFFLAIGGLLIFAAVVLERRAIQMALGACSCTRFHI